MDVLEPTEDLVEKVLNELLLEWARGQKSV